MYFNSPLLIFSPHLICFPRTIWKSFDCHHLLDWQDFQYTSIFLSLLCHNCFFSLHCSAFGMVFLWTFMSLLTSSSLLVSIYIQLCFRFANPSSLWHFYLLDNGSLKYNLQKTKHSDVYQTCFSKAICLMWWLFYLSTD